MKIIPVILSGGHGKRLWPLSRRNLPKQFLALSSLASGDSLFEQTLLRCRRRAFDERPIVVGAHEHRFLIGQALCKISADADVILEPSAKDTCAAIAAACLHAARRAENPLLLIMPTDHDIADVASFAMSVERAAPAAKSGKLVIFGTEPESPNPNYGYFARGHQEGDCFAVSHFVEKPGAARAASLITAGYLWNCGMFLLEARTGLDLLQRYQPGILEKVEAAYRERVSDTDFTRLEERAYRGCEAVSFDTGVLERADCIRAMPVRCKWKDVGNWDGFAQLGVTDEAGNTVFGDLVSHDSHHNVVHSEGRFTALVGARNLVVISTEDAVLVADRERSGEMAALINKLEARDHRTLESRTTRRPWGSFENIRTGEGYQVKRLNVLPGGELSLQKHVRRAEYWVVVRGRAKVTLGSSSAIHAAGSGIHIPRGAVHRLANAGDEVLVVVEVQTGDYLGEDDLIRLEDIYDRCSARENGSLPQNASRANRMPDEQLVSESEAQT